MKKRNYWTSLMAVAIASMLYANSVFAALPLAMTGRGSGTETGLADSCDGSGNSCNGSNCVCYMFSGTGMATGVGALTFTTNLLLFPGTVNNLACEAASGVLVLTQKGNSSNVLMLDYQGASCIDNAAFVFNGSYSVDGTKSVGKFAGAMGSGTLTGSVDASSTLTLGNLSGTLLP
jgi:hypothetical protein